MFLQTSGTTTLWAEPALKGSRKKYKFEQVLHLVEWRGATQFFSITLYPDNGHMPSFYGKNFNFKPFKLSSFFKLRSEKGIRTLRTPPPPRGIGHSACRQLKNIFVPNCKLVLVWSLKSIIIASTFIFSFLLFLCLFLFLAYISRQTINQWINQSINQFYIITYSETSVRRTPFY